MMDKNSKWTMICQSKEEQSTTAPENFIQILNATGMLTLKDAEKLRVSLAHENMAWLQKFIDLDGVKIFFRKFKALLDTTYVTSFII